MGPGVRFTLFKYDMPCFQIFSFSEVDLKDETDLVKSGIPADCCDEGSMSKYFPSTPGFCGVGGALFMIGGIMHVPETRRSKLLWSAPSPPIPVGSSTMTWIRWAAMGSGRLYPMVVPLHDGRIFICGGTPEPEGWIEIYDPQKDKFDRRDMPYLSWSPFPSACFEWANHLVMLFFSEVNLTEEEHSKPTLLLYNVETNIWELVADNLPNSERYPLEQRKLIYVGRNILFLIDQASGWFVYALS